MQSRTENTDYLIIGAGSTGCVLANRLSANASNRVTILEAGGHDRHRKLNWGYTSEAEANLNDRRIACPRGRVVGGSSSINGMVYIRGNSQDFDRWQDLGARGWNTDSVLPYFKKAQHFSGIDTQHPFKGHNGPLAVTDGAMSNPLYQMFLDAAKQAGHASNDDLNGADQEGFGALPMTVAAGVRASAAQAYLHPDKNRNNLTIVSGALAHKILFAGTQAIGAKVKVRGQITNHFANNIIICAGAINSPQLLLLSGLGPGAELQAMDIKRQVDLPGVGKNLMDHLEVYVQQAYKQPISLYIDLSVWGRGKIGLWNQSGLGATNHFEAGGFIKSSAEVPYPDIQFHFLPAAMQYDGSAKANMHGFQAHVGPGRLARIS